MTEKWRKILDQGEDAAALITDLSKAFDCIDHDLLIAKLHAYGFRYNSLKYAYSYITEREQRVKINSTYSNWSKIPSGVPQGSILGPLLFNIYLCDLFLICEDIDYANYADDTTPYVCDTNLESILKRLQDNSDKFFL